jgi:hypothetical protein
MNSPFDLSLTPFRPQLRQLTLHFWFVATDPSLHRATRSSHESSVASAERVRLIDFHWRIGTIKIAGESTWLVLLGDDQKIAAIQPSLE